MGDFTVTALVTVLVIEGSHFTVTALVTVQVIEGSHKCGRIDHDLVAGQQKCNEERLQQIRNKLPHKFVEMDPGWCT